ncbi:MAG TPA: CRISPR-associated endoribonuclease Cas6 [Parafilimonas sp.]|nr:CRISPR-associated endoribonuclease Cas6 [Parafilimonas sp.]
MRLQLTLTASQTHALLPVNYQYPLSAAIYKIIERADSGYSAFLHNTGYTVNGKRFKLFTFSDLRTPFIIQGDRLLMKARNATVTICFHVPVAAENFIKGLFMHQQLDIADYKSRVQFTVQQVEMLPVQVSTDMPVLLQPVSPLVVGKKNERGNYDYLAPGDADYVYWLLHNWKEKCATVYSEDAAAMFQQVAIKVINANKARSRLITIKAGTPEATQIRGFMGFRLEVTAPKEVLELGLNAGVGLYNAMGCGCVGIR